VLGGVEVGADPGDEVGEGFDVWVGGPGEEAELGLVVVAGVEEQDFGVGDEVVPVLGSDVVAGLGGVDAALRKAMISCLTWNLRRPKGRSSAEENFTSERSRPVRVARRSRSRSMVSPEPASVPLMPSGARMRVPQRASSSKVAMSSSRSSVALGRATKR
jgi:hypothetical protein